MRLTFTPQEAIMVMSGPKIHHIVLANNRQYRNGSKIICLKPAPNRSKEEFMQLECTGIQTINVQWLYNAQRGYGMKVIIDGKAMTDQYFLDRIARNEGLLKKSNFINHHLWYNSDYNGEIIHWKYGEFYT